MSLFATLNPEQNGYVQVARNSPSPFDIGACFDAAFVAGLVAYLGMIACLIGVFATAPMAGLMHAAAYERLFSPKAIA